MNKILNAIVVLILLLFFNTKLAFTQENPEDIPNKFFEYFTNDEVEKAVDYVFSTNIWMEKTPEAIIEIKKQLKKAVVLLGKFYGYELIESKFVGQSFVEYVYMLKYDRQPIIITFLIYKPNKKWQIFNLRFEDKLDRFLDMPPKTNQKIDKKENIKTDNKNQ